MYTSQQTFEFPSRRAAPAAGRSHGRYHNGLTRPGRRAPAHKRPCKNGSLLHRYLTCVGHHVTRRNLWAPSSPLANRETFLHDVAEGRAEVRENYSRSTKRGGLDSAELGRPGYILASGVDRAHCKALTNSGCRPHRRALTYQHKLGGAAARLFAFMEGLPPAGLPTSCNRQ